MKGERDLRLTDAAFGVLFEHLKEDYRDCHGGQGESVLADAVTDAIRSQDLLRMNRADVLALTDAVVQAVAKTLQSSNGP